MITIELKKKKPITYYMDSEKVLPTIKAVDVLSITATDTELELILSGFHNLPHTSALTQVWVGEFAKMVVANLYFLLNPPYNDKEAGKVAVGVMEE